jgi:deoxyribodipyrimidine photo-lyase
MQNELVIHWFRRDLRLEDNAALFQALKSEIPVLCVFIFDKNILEDLKHGNGLTNDRRVGFIYTRILELKIELNKLGSDLRIYYDVPSLVWKEIIAEFIPKAVFANQDYEPYAIKRDNEIAYFLNSQDIDFKLFKDQCIFEKQDVVKDDGRPYTVFTPYCKKWYSKIESDHFKAFPTEKYFHNFYKIAPQQEYSKLQDMGFVGETPIFLKPIIDVTLIVNYENTRDFPALDGTSRLSVHLRFGTISIRKLVEVAYVNNAFKFLNELVWREFYMMILFHFPHVVDTSFKKDYDKILWRNNEYEFELWCKGKTGYPIVDAGMRELNNTGYMHNRVRMIVASFLVKHLLIDWRWGEAYFAQKLLDYELASNNGGWQWAAGCGCDAVPYFRVFNPTLQAQKFDVELKYIRKWVPEIDTLQYPLPIVDHSLARNRAIEVFKNALGNE